MSLLELREVHTHFALPGRAFSRRRAGVVQAVDGVSLRIEECEILGLVGESGCGKSTLGRSILQLVRPTSGQVLFDGADLCGLAGGELRRLRRQIQIVFQDPYSSLNPRMSVYDAIGEPFRVHRRVSRRDLPGVVRYLMTQVELPGRHMRRYPHEFSGGQRQRIAIARALALEPRLLVADEPVSALDVSVQAGILNLFAKLCRQRRLAMLFISHDLAVVRHLAHRIAVMYLGKIVEIGPAGALFDNPQHPYTRALLEAIPLPDPRRERRRGNVTLAGEPPSPQSPPPGCRFHPRCPYAEPACAQSTPRLEAWRENHHAACLRLGKIDWVSH